METKSKIKIVFGMVYDICPHCGYEVKRDPKAEVLTTVDCPFCSGQYEQSSVMESLENESFSFTDGCNPSACSSCPIGCR